jgi:hypothetical protein
MPDGFIQKNSSFRNLQELVDASGISNPEDIEGSKLSEFISANTQFNNWEDMLEKATAEYIKRKLGL